MNTKRLIICGIIILFTVLCYIAIMLFAPIHTLTFTSDACVNLFGVSIQEFMEKEFEFYNETGDFRKNAQVDENGELTITLSKIQMLNWKNTKWLSDFSEYPEKDPFVISSDYKKLDVYISSDTDPESDEYQAILQEGLRIIARLDILQTANGVPDAFSYIEFTVIDKDTGEILAQRRYQG